MKPEKTIHIVVGGLLIIAMLFPCSAAGDTLRIIESPPGRTVYEWTVPEIQWQSVTTTDQDYVIPVMDSLHRPTTAGSPMIPQFSILVENATLTDIQVLDTVYTVQSTRRICPVPTLQIASDGQTGSTVYIEDPAIYQADRFYPAQFVDFETGIYKDRSLLRLIIYPALYNPARGAIKQLRYIKFAIIGATPRAGTSLTGADRVLNRAITATLPPQPRSLKKPVADTPWMDFNAGRDMVKICTVNEGIYRVTGAQLQSLGLSMTSIIPDEIRLFNKGAEQPCLVNDGNDGVLDTDDAILFYAERLDGDSLYYNAWSDTNSYWLTWGGDPGIRYSETTANPADGSPITTYRCTLHNEQDLEYYNGDTNQDIQDSETAAGEGWVWTQTFYSGTIYNFYFDLPGLLSSGQDSALLRMRLRGTTWDAAANDHHVRLTLNGTPVYEAWFDDRQELLATAVIPASLLRSAGNQLDIHSVDDTEAEISQFYLDWYEIEYTRALAAANGQLEFTQNQIPARQTCYINGFQSDSVHIWNLRQNTLHPAGSVSKGWLADIHVLSAGYSDGNYASFLVNGSTVYDGGRGISLLVLDSATGAILQSRTFDTWESATDADSLVAFINRQELGATVLAAIKDEGSNQLREPQYAALESLGSAHIRTLGGRDSWALIGRKGASPGSAIEAHSTSGTGAVNVADTLFFPNGGSSFMAEFTPPENNGDNYIIFEPAGLLSPAGMEKVTPDRLASPANGADYIIITHPAFRQQAEHLADYRRSFNGFRTMIALVGDIYNEFNYGLKDPAAIRDFLHYAWKNWQTPAPAFVLLLGDASWDPKQNLASAYKTDFVPVWGNPVSDNWYVCFDGPNDLLSEMHIGRLPVETAAAAENIIDKMIVYESQPSALWKKKFMLISGGFEEYELFVFNRQTEQLAGDFITPPPLGGQAQIIKKETPGYQEGVHRDDIINLIDSGVVWGNFIGHAGSSTWDLMFHNPDIDALNNSPHYPIITSMTCHTGRFAEPNQDSFGEHFLLAQNKGAIAFWGTAGWGYSWEDYIFLRELLQVVVQDTVYRAGEAITLAKFALWNTLGSGSHATNLLRQYTLLGDPALQLALPDKPDLTIPPDALNVKPAIPNEADSLAAIHVQVHNWGLVPQSQVAVRVTAEHATHGKSQVDTVKTLSPFTLTDSLVFSWPLRGMTGAVQLEALADPDNLVAEADENNNRQSSQVYVVSNLIQPVFPADMSVCPAQGLVLKIQNPQQVNNQVLFFEFEIDTSLSFNSTLLQRSGQVARQTLITTWKPLPLAEGLYYWRCRAAADSSETAWVISSFYADAVNRYGWRQERASQFARNKAVGAQLTANHIELEKQIITLYAESAGYSDGNYARLIINSDSPLTIGRGINMVIVDGRNGEILSARVFDTWEDAAAADSLAAVIDRQPDGHYILCAIKDEGSAKMNENGYRALESIGSALCRKTGSRDSWAIIGVKGAAPGSVPEAHQITGAGVVRLESSITLYTTQGVVTTPKIGPATAWGELTLLKETPAATVFSVDVTGYHRSGRVDTLYKDFSGSALPLSTLDSAQYPYLALQARLTTTNGNYSPALHWWQVTSSPAADPAIGFDTFTQSADTVLTGEKVTVNVDIHNIGPVPLTPDSLTILFEEKDAVLGRRTFATAALTAGVPVDSFITVSREWSSAGRNGERQLFITIDPDYKLSEANENNNYLTTFVYVRKDTVNPALKVTFDGREIMYGDMVASRPVILAGIYDNSPQMLDDTSYVNIFLDDRRVPFAGQTEQLKIRQSADAGARAVVEFTPVLADGEHNLSIMAVDASNNSIVWSEAFQVVNDLKLLNVINYPNPFAGKTDFTFELSQPAQIRIKIFTVAGRLIQEIERGWAAAGFNTIPWDGRDADGDKLANGVYLYKIYAVNGAQKTEELSKFIVMR
ncbi:MAG TPA: C25 family cysteine peptidase [bacterium]|nr:C25 family cysteine peptidase [bacterium]HPN45219.1 C25 family cysteine peptidase [bacterium]